MNVRVGLSIAECVIVAVSVAPNHAAATDAAWPMRPIRIIVAQPAGGPPDLIARHIGDGLSRNRGSPVIVDDRPGASGIIGIDLPAALRACLDGRRWTGPTDLPQGPGHRLALFPQEWYRAPESSWLTTLPSDAPWHDPRLFEAMLKIPYADEPRLVASGASR